MDDCPDIVFVDTESEGCGRHHEVQFSLRPRLADAITIPVVGLSGVGLGPPVLSSIHDIGYGFGVIAAILAVFIELVWGPIAAAGLDPMWTIAIAALVVTALSYRLAKGIWFSLLFRFGLMAWPDGTASDGTRRVPAQGTR